MKANCGFIGLAMTAHMFALKTDSNGFRVARYDLDEKMVAAFGQKIPQKNRVGGSTLEKLFTVPQSNSAHAERQ